MIQICGVTSVRWLADSNLESFYKPFWRLQRLLYIVGYFMCQHTVFFRWPLDFETNGVPYSKTSPTFDLNEKTQPFSLFCKKSEENDRLKTLEFSKNYISIK